MGPGSLPLVPAAMARLAEHIGQIEPMPHFIETLGRSFSVVSNPIFAIKYSLYSIFQNDLQDLHTFAPLRTSSAKSHIVLLAIVTECSLILLFVMISLVELFIRIL